MTRAERDRRDGEPRATIRRLIEQVQNAAYDGHNEAERVAAETVEQLVAMIERGPKPPAVDPWEGVLGDPTWGCNRDERRANYSRHLNMMRGPYA